jgi:hypothetical protein
MDLAYSLCGFLVGALVGFTGIAADDLDGPDERSHHVGIRNADICKPAGPEDIRKN